MSEPEQTVTFIGFVISIHVLDILALLEQKTKGNLTAEERQVLEQVLYELRLRFVQAQQAADDRPRIIQP